ncbi:bifunctional homocysteine S-methyltransferase/methylenetetrahydrofolate reductase [Pendulispora albinea]|uniref:Bifunctional homocysteine S-methyltransferase/methylenetetrahydrofolate reductase n=1 Tax=Pendulispora albinea TaxID=2741071 RepID=A0ABZ2M8D9_9BACT
MTSRPLRPFLEQLAAEPLVVDGAMGTQLYERGILYSSCFEELNVSRPEVVVRVHEDYVKAGANVLETNTFGANALRLEKHGLQARVRELNLAGVELARKAAAGRAFVAGAIGPSGYFLGEASARDLAKVEAALGEQAEALVEGGVDVLVVETFRQPNELLLALDAAVRASKGKVPIIASASLDEHGRMADGTMAHEIALQMKDHGASILGVNCSDGPMNVLAAAEQMLGLDLPVCAVPNAGLPRRVDERLVYVSTPEYFGLYARRMFKLGVRMVGGCCGTTPDHIKRIAASARMAGAADGSRNDPESQARDTVVDGISQVSVPVPRGLVPVAFETKSTLSAKIGKEFVVSVEVNPPIGLDPSRALNAARMLKEGGVDVINIADGARAQARMSNLVMAGRVQRDIGIETILHVCGRDRNLLGTLAHLLGAHDMGIRNLVIITGDPPKMGEFPDATPVYDLDSIGILKLAARLNNGIDPGGRALGDVTQFVLATGAEPSALNYAREIERVKMKKEAGAELIMTQPVYDPAALDRFLADIAPLGLPVLVGLLPLASYRNAEFLHNEVPGMQVPEHVRDRMRKAGGGAQGRKEGVAIAREMLAAVRDKVAGAYIMPPLERYELALEVIDGFKGPVAAPARAGTG